MEYDLDYDEQLALIEANELTPEQYRTFLDELTKIPSKRSPITGSIARLCFEFMEDTGTRATETIHVRKRDIDFRTRILTVIHPKTHARCKCSRWKYADMHSRRQVLEYADKNCKVCHGAGTWKKPQRTTFTPRLHQRLYDYCQKLKDDDELFPVSRQTLWRWGKKAGKIAGINIFQQKKERMIEGVFLHLFRALCSKRTTADAINDKYKDALVACKMRHSYKVVTDRYTEVTIGYLVSFERRAYSVSP
jgi:integrase